MQGSSVSRQLLACVSRNFFLVAGTTVLTVFAVWLAAVFVYEPEYTATSQVFIEPLSPEASQVNVAAEPDDQTLSAYQILAKSPSVLTRAIERTESAYSISELHKRVTVYRPENSQVLKIVVTDRSKSEGAELANSIAFSLQEEVLNLLKVDNVSIILKADTADSSIEESRVLSFLLIIAAGVGATAGTALSLLTELIPFLGRLSLFAKKKGNLQTVFK